MVRFMINSKLLDDLAQHLAKTVPTGIQVLQDDLKYNLRAGLEASLSHLDLVTREEFDVQTAVLSRTREKLDALERQMAELEQNLAS